MAPGLALLVEAVAQAASLLLGGDSPAAGQRLFLGGIEDAAMTAEPEPGDSITIEVRLRARLGGVVRVRGELRRGEETFGGATLILSSGENG